MKLGFQIAVKEPIQDENRMDASEQPAWTRDRIQKLIDDKIEEGPNLDYKASAALNRNDSKKMDQITKDVSAFANSAGGLVIYGVKEFGDNLLNHLPEKIDPVDGREYSREWLDQITGQISPRISGLTITPVRVGPESWHTCYVVEIPKSNTAHQARDLRYYRRYNFESVPMADYEIRDVMSRRDHPNLEFKIQVHHTSNMTIKIMGRIWNRGSVLARHYRIRALIPTIIDRAKLWEDGLIVQEEAGMKFWRVSLGNPLSGPLFPGDDVIVGKEIPATSGGVPQPSADFIVCALYADEMPAIKRNISVLSAMNNWV
jgi:hypothetical protein